MAGLYICLSVVAPSTQLFKFASNAWDATGPSKAELAIACSTARSRRLLGSSEWSPISEPDFLFLRFDLTAIGYYLPYSINNTTLVKNMLGKWTSFAVLKAAGVVISLLMLSFYAHGFAEDACPSSAPASSWQACSLEPCRLGSEHKTCETIALLTTVTSQGTSSKNGGSRSSVHFDATYYLAQAAGFSPRDAHMIAAYDQAVDTGQYVHRGNSSQLLVDPAKCSKEGADPACALNTLTMGGLDRNNFVSGGVFFHFMAPRMGASHDDGLAPDVDDPAAELFLNHLRRWAYGLGPLCVGGLTNASTQGDLASGVSCFNTTTRSPPLLMGRIPAASELGYLGFADWLAPLGEQTIVTEAATGKNTVASDLPKYFTRGEQPLVRLGIYLHALQDRISHHRCVDVSHLDGPRPADADKIIMNPFVSQLYLLYQSPSLQTLQQLVTGAQLTTDPDFFYVFDTDECDQLSHANRHTWEVGAPQQSLQPRDQTTRAALLATLHELRAFAVRFQLGMPEGSAVEDEALLDDLIVQLETNNPADRLAALGDMAVRRGMLPPAGFVGMTYADWDAKAGMHIFDAAPRGLSEAVSRVGVIGPAGLTILLSLWLIRGFWRRRVRPV